MNAHAIIKPSFFTDPTTSKKTKKQREHPQRRKVRQAQASLHAQFNSQKYFQGIPGRAKVVYGNTTDGPRRLQGDSRWY